MSALKSLRQVPNLSGYKPGDVVVIFGELFGGGYANGLVEEAERRGLTIVRSTVGRRDNDGLLRALTAEETAAWPRPFINIPLEAGFDLEPADNGTSPADQLQGVKMGEWTEAQLDWTSVHQSREKAIARFRKNVEQYMLELKPLIPKGANVLFVHTMAGGVPRARILMSAMNRVFKGQGERHMPSERFWTCDIGKLAAMNFEEVTANTFQHLLDLSSDVRQQIESGGGRARYVAYGYHGTEVLIQEQYRWQTYTPYVQGWAKIKLENYAEKAWAQGLHATVYNCPEILTNSSSIFLGVEVSLYPLMGALQREGAQSPYAQNLLKKCQALLKDSHTIAEVLRFTDEYLNSDIIRRYTNFAQWPEHNGQQQMEKMLQSSAHLIAMHKDPEQLITYLLSAEIFRATGKVMFHDSWQSESPVWWLNHDVLAQQLASEKMV